MKFGEVKHILLSIMAAVIIAGVISIDANSVIASEEEKLVEEDFDHLEDGALPDEWRVVQGEAGAVNGKLELSSPNISDPARVLIPMEEGTGDYVFEADVTFKSAVNDARWVSLMYRVQNEDYPYYQFAVRRGTSALNGLEFAIRTENNAWDVQEKTFYTEDFQYDETYRLKVIVKGSRVQQFVNDQLFIDTDAAIEWNDGDIGFQVSGAIVEFDNVLVTTQTEELPPLQSSEAYLPNEPETNMLNAPTVISQNLPENLDEFTENGVSSMVLQTDLDDNGDVTVENELLSDLLQSVNGEVIPVIQIEDDAHAEGVITALKASSLKDVHVMSTKPEIIEEIKESYPTARGTILYDRNHFNKHDLNQLVKDINRTKSTTAAIPQNLLDNENIYYLHSRAISVWGIGGNTIDEAHALIHSGVDGIISEDALSAVEAYNKYPANTLVQRPIVVAHRGVPSLAPENTMAGYELSYELGADLIETDIQATKDGHIVIMHDTTVNRTTDGTGNVSDLTLEEIKALDAGSYFGPEFEGEGVPTLIEFLEGFKDRDVVLLVELKDVGIEEQVLREIEEVGMEDHVVLQSFDMESVLKLRKLNPEITVGYLYSSGVPATPEQKIADAEEMLNYATNHGVRLNASYGSLSQEFITYMRQRGMMNMHWTFRDEGALEDQLKQGLIGPITDYTQWLTEAPVRIDTPIKKRNLKVGKSATIQAKAFLNPRVGKTENIETTLLSALNQDNVAVNANTVTAVSPGTAHVLVNHNFEMIGKEWNIVSNPIRVNVSD
ncbi:glycerophosphodiester phosphodiesterase family protein [Virgibacillus oceani]